MPYSASIYRLQQEGESAAASAAAVATLPSSNFVSGSGSRRSQDRKEILPLPLSSFETWEEVWSYTRRTVDTQMPLLKVTISDPVTESDGYLGAIFNKYVSYKVKTTPAPFAYEVRRRFSDFAWLRNILVQRYPGMMIPSLPEKNYFATSAATINFSGLNAPPVATAAIGNYSSNIASTSFSKKGGLHHDNNQSVGNNHVTPSTESINNTNKTADNFIRFRIRTLTLFMDYVMENPFLCADSAVIAFLSKKVKKEWSDTMQIMQLDRELKQDQTTGKAYWKQLIDGTSYHSIACSRQKQLQKISSAAASSGKTGNEEDTRRENEYHNPFSYGIEGEDIRDLLLVDFANQLDLAEVCVDKLLVHIKSLALVTNQKAQNMHAIHQQFKEWYSLEESFTNPVQFRCTNQHKSTMLNLMDGVNCVFENWTNILTFQPYIMNHIFHDGIVFLKQQIGSMRELLKGRDKIMKERRKLEKELSVLIVEKERNTERYSGGNIYQVDNTNIISENKKANTSLTKDQILSLEISRKNEAIDCLTKPLFFCEIDRFNAEREGILRMVLQEFAACTLQYSKRLHRIWFQSEEAERVNTNAEENHGRSLLGGLQSKEDGGIRTDKATFASIASSPASTSSAVHQTSPMKMNLNLEKGLNEAKLLLKNTEIVQKSC